MVENKSQKLFLKFISYILMIFTALVCLVPFMIVISASFSGESELIKYGYGIFPKGATLDAYRVVMRTKKALLNAYGITIFTTAVGSFLSILITCLTAYPLSRRDYKHRTVLSFYFYFTMLFSGGTIPSYILISQYLHLKNNILVLIIPLLLNVYNVFLIRTYFSQLNSAMIEAAKIDGAGELYTFFKIVIPVCKTGIATVLLLICLTYWNEWYQCLMYMTKEKNITLQYYLYKIMSNVDLLTKNTTAATTVSIDVSKLPSETARMAICVLAAGPMVFLFMFFQKYFVKGISVGSVKG